MTEVKDNVEVTETETGKSTTESQPDQIITIEALRLKYGVKTSNIKSNSTPLSNSNIRVVLDTVERSGKITLAFVPPKAYVPNSWSKLQSEDLSKMNDDEKKVYNALMAELVSFKFIQKSDEAPQERFGARVMNFTSVYMEIQLDFSEPLLVS